MLNPTHNVSVFPHHLEISYSSSSSSSSKKREKTTNSQLTPTFLFFNFTGLNIVVTSSGSATPEGTLGTALYTSTDPGIVTNIYTSPVTYEMPGPALYAGAGSPSTNTSGGGATKRSYARGFRA